MPANFAAVTPVAGSLAVRPGTAAPNDGTRRAPSDPLTVTFSISLPSEMATEFEEIQRKEHRTHSELIREALRRYFADADHVRHE